MKKRFFFLCIIILCGILYFAQSEPFLSSEKPSEATDPFTISVSEAFITDDIAELGQETTGEEQTGPRLTITADIENHTENSFKDVWYELELNEEVKPYLASQILQFSSDKMNVIPQKDNTNDQQNTDSQKKPSVTGFHHEWGLLLASAEDLKEYHERTPDGIQDALKTLTVRVHWNNGTQEVTLPLNLTSTEP